MKLPALPSDVKTIALAAAVVGLALWWITRKGVAASVGSAVGGAAVDLITGTAAGTVIAAGSAVGVPETSTTQCQKDQAAGDTWAASFSCPAGTFIKGLFGSAPASADSAPATTASGGW